MTFALLIGLLAPAPLIMLITGIELFKAPSGWKVILFLYWALFFLAAYSLDPQSTNDLTRYWVQLETCKELTLPQAIQYFDDGLIVENVLFWFFGHLGDVRVFPALSASIVYAVGAYIAGDYCQRIKLSKAFPVVLILQMSMLPFFSLVNNVRNVFAFSLIVLAVYREYVEEKKDIFTLALYIAPVFMHKTGMILLLVRLLVPLFRRVYSFSIILVLLFSSLIGVANNILNRITIGGRLGRILTRLIRSAYKYMTVETAYSISIQNSTLQTLLRYLIMGATIMILIMTSYYIRKSRLWGQHENFSIYCFFLGIFTLSCNIFDAPAYWRFSCANIISFSPIFAALLKLYFERNLNKWITVSMALFILFCGARYFLNMVVFVFRRIDPAVYFSNFIINNILSVIGKVLVNVLTI